MFWQPRISLAALARFCRTLSTLLHSGVPILKAFDTAAGKTRDRRLRDTIDAVVLGLRKGDDVALAMRSQGRYFPVLLVDMIAIAEHTGSLPEVLSGLADHYDNLLRLRRQFLGAIAWPLFQLIAAIFIIAGLIYILGWIANLSGNDPVDVLGWGLIGASGALTWLGLCFGSAFMLFVAYQLLVKGLGQQRALHSLFMMIPVLGNCLRSFAIARFSWAFYLTQEAGMRIAHSLEASLRATSNGAFIGAAPRMVALVKEGEELSTAFLDSGLFPEDYIQMVVAAETSGTVPEMMQRMSPQFEEQARRSLAVLTFALSWLIWLIVAAFIVFVIISIVLWYVGMLNDAMSGI